MQSGELISYLLQQFGRMRLALEYVQILNALGASRFLPRSLNEFHGVAFHSARRGGVLVATQYVIGNAGEPR
jgi:hypothetical protein